MYRERAAALVDGLHRYAPDLRFTEPEGGFSLWIETDETGDEVALLRAALAEGVMIDPGSAFRAEPGDRIAFRVSFSHEPPARLDDGARRIARMWQRFMTPRGH